MRARETIFPIDVLDRGGARVWSIARLWLAAALVAAGYYVGVKVGLALTFHPQPVSALWPANAILLAALLIAPVRAWPVLLLAVLPPHIFAELNGGVPLTMVLSWYVSNCAEALLGAYLVRRLNPGRLRLNTVRGLTLFVVVCAVLAPFLSSFLDAGLVALNGWGDSSYWNVWRMRFLSNMLAVQILVPVVLESGSDKLRAARQMCALRWLEMAALGASIVAVCFVAFVQPEAEWPIGPAKIYAPLPLLLWATVRFGTYGVSLALAAVTFASTWGAAHGNGPFVGLSVSENALSVQLFLVLTAVPLSMVATLIAERASATEALQESRRAERAKREDDERMALAAASANIGFWSYEVATRRLWVTDQYRSIFGVKPEVVLTAASSISLIHADDRDRAIRTFADVARTGTPLETEFRVTRPDGVSRDLAVSGRAERDANGAVVRLTGVATDMTKRRQAEREATERRREVAHLSRVATVGELSGALAHELAQPLAAIMSNAQVAGRMLQREPFDVPLLREILQDIVSDDRRGANVIRHLRDLLRKEDSPRELLDLRDVVREVLSLQRSDLVEHEIEVTTRFDDQPMLIIGDRVQLEQVLLNVIMNARDAMEIVPAKKRRLKVEIDQINDSVHVSVSDSGVGITRANLQRVFESFYTTKPKGLGLGLPICRAIIDDHGGSLWAESDGVGATLRIALPTQRDVRDTARDVGRGARVAGPTTGSRLPAIPSNQQPVVNSHPTAKS